MSKLKEHLKSLKPQDKVEYVFATTIALGLLAMAGLGLIGYQDHQEKMQQIANLRAQSTFSANK